MISWKADFKRLLEDESGVGVIEVVLILVVLIGLVAIFRTNITTLINTIFDSINSQAEGIL